MLSNEKIIYRSVNFIFYLKYYLVIFYFEYLDLSEFDYLVIIINNNETIYCIHIFLLHFYIENIDNFIQEDNYIYLYRKYL